MNSYIALLASAAALAFAAFQSNPPTPTAGQTEEKPIVFKTQVKPILDKYCIGCHSGERPAAKLDLSKQEGITKGGVSGKLYVAKKSKESLLIIRVKGEKGKPKMPPGKRSLKKADIEILTKWIDEGAKFETK